MPISSHYLSKNSKLFGKHLSLMGISAYAYNRDSWSDMPAKQIMAKKSTWKDTLGKATLGNPDLNRKALKLKKSFDEIDNLLKGLDKSNKKQK